MDPSFWPPSVIFFFYSPLCQGICAPMNAAALIVPKLPESFLALSSGSKRQWDDVFGSHCRYVCKLIIHPWISGQPIKEISFTSDCFSWFRIYSKIQRLLPRQMVRFSLVSNTELGCSLLYSRSISVSVFQIQEMKEKAVIKFNVLLLWWRNFFIWCL